MKKILVTVASLILSLGLLQPSCANPNPFQITDALDKRIQDGLSHLYNLEFNEADKIFRELHDQAAEHPMVAFGKASVHWWRLSVFVLETDPTESKAFIEAVNECIQLSKKKIDRGDPTGEGYLTLGGACGLLGRWQATNQEWISAYFTGKKAIKYLRKALKVNPEMKDANMGLGIFDYYVATLPAVVRVLAFLGTGGDSQVGIKELTTAAYEGTYSRTPSKLFLAEIYSNQENNPDKALEILSGLQVEYPKSGFIQMMRVIAFYNHNRLDSLAQEANDFLNRVNTGVYSKDFSVQAHFALGAVQFKSKQWQEAANEYQRAISSGTVKDPFYTWSHLYRAYSLDALGQRSEAVALYKEVLKQIRRWGSWEAAKKGINKPFTPTDEFLKKLRL